MRPGTKSSLARIAVVLDALDQRAGAVPDSDDGDSHLAVVQVAAVVADVAVRAHRVVPFSAAAEASWRCTERIRCPTVNVVRAASTAIPQGSAPNGERRMTAASSTTRSARPISPAFPSRPRASARARVYDTRKLPVSATKTAAIAPGGALACEDERRGSEHEALGDAIGRRVDEGAERRRLAAETCQRAVEDVDDRPDEERDAGEDVLLLEQEHGGDDVEREAERGELVGSHAALAQRDHAAARERARPVGVAGLDAMHGGVGGHGGQGSRRCRRLRASAATSGRSRPTNGQVASARADVQRVGAPVGSTRP